MDTGIKLGAILIALSLFGCAAEPKPFVEDEGSKYWNRQVKGLLEISTKPTPGIYVPELDSGDATSAYAKENYTGPGSYYDWERKRIPAYNSAKNRTRAHWYEFFIEAGYQHEEAEIMASKMMR